MINEGEKKHVWFSSGLKLRHPGGKRGNVRPRNYSSEVMFVFSKVEKNRLKVKLVFVLSLLIGIADFVRLNNCAIVRHIL